MKLRIRRTGTVLHLEADSGSGYVGVKALDLPQLPAVVHAAVTAPGTIGAWPIQLRSES